MEEILKKMEEMVALKNDRDSVTEKENLIKERQNEIEKMYREQNLIVNTSPLKEIKEEEIQNKTTELEKMKTAVEEEKKAVKEKVEKGKKELISEIDEKMSKYKRKAELDEMRKEIEAQEQKKNVYQKVADNAQKTIDKIQKEVLEGKLDNIHLLKNAQEEKQGNLVQVERLEKDIKEQKNEFNEYKPLEDFAQEYSDLEHLRMRMIGISYSNFDRIEDEIKNQSLDEDSKENQVEEIEKVKETETRINNDSEVLELDDDTKEKITYNLYEDNENQGPVINPEIIKSKLKPEIIKLENKHNLNGYYKNKNLKILISEKDKKLTIGYTDKELGKGINKEVDLYGIGDFAIKKELYKKLDIAKICKECSNGRIEAFRLRRKLNPSIVNALSDNKEMLQEYIKATKEQKELPFELIHSLEGLNGIQRFMKQRSRILKAEEKCGAKILGKWFDKNKTIGEGNVAKKYKHTSEEGNKELIEVEKQKLEKYKLDNKDNRIEEKAKENIKEDEKITSPFIEIVNRQKESKENER